MKTNWSDDNWPQIFKKLADELVKKELQNEYIKSSDEAMNILQEANKISFPLRKTSDIHFSIDKNENINNKKLNVEETEKALQNYIELTNNSFKRSQNLSYEEFSKVIY